MANASPPSGLAGRTAEIEALRAALARAFAGESTSVLVGGEPGIGKTALCHAALTALVDPAVPRLLISCLPLQSLASGLAPLRTALRRSSASAALTRTCLARLDEGDVLRAVDDWVEDVVAQTPVVIVVDDVQWAESSLRDVLLYLLAGPADRRLAVLLTVRSTGLPDGHPLHGWLADVLRLPRVERLVLEPLSRAGTEAQLADLLGGPPHQSLVDDVVGASRGNPYFTALLSRDVRPDQHHLPDAFPGDLIAAVAAVWHDCSPPARTLTCLLAVMGGPQSAAALDEVVRELDLPVDVKDCLADARANGLVEVAGDDRFWFRHPLQAEVLVQTTTWEQRRVWYAALARVGDGSPGGGDTGTFDAALVQFVRHDRAGTASAAYRWALRAYELGAGRTSTVELRRILRRAIALRPEVAGAVEEPSLLWQRLAALASDAGAFVEELEAVEALIALSDPGREPLRLSELLVRRMLLRMVTVTGFCSVEEMSRASELAAVDPRSWQYAFAQAELSHAASWWDDPRAAAAAAERGLAVARAAGHPAALSFALTASAIVRSDAGDHARSRRLAAEAVEVACVARDWWAYVHAVMWESNALPARHGWPEVEYFTRRRAELAELGGPGLVSAAAHGGRGGATARTG